MVNGQRQLLEVPHEHCYHGLDLRDCILACLHGYRATAYLAVTCPLSDHHLDALTERVGAPKLVIALAAVLYFPLASLCVILRGPKALSVCAVPFDCCGAETGCSSAAYPFGRTLRDREGAKNSPGVDGAMAVAGPCPALCSLLIALLSRSRPALPPPPPVKYGQAVSPTRGPAPKGTRDLSMSIMVPCTRVPLDTCLFSTDSAGCITPALSGRERTIAYSAAPGQAGMALLPCASKSRASPMKATCPAPGTHHPL